MQKKYKGSITIEVSCLLPVIALVFVLSVWGGFYYHDKNILSACAYETAVIGGTKTREKEPVTEEILMKAFQERVAGKCILFSEIDASIQMNEEAIIVRATGGRRHMRTSVIHMAAVTEPEDYIRNIRRLR